MDVESSESVVGHGPIESRFPVDFNGLNVKWNDADPDQFGQFNTALILASTLNSELRNLRGVDLTSSGTGYIEARPKGIDKGSVLSKIAQRYCIDRDNVLAIGDNDNDYEMLDWAGLSIVPSNASTNAKEAASVISPHQDHNCVIEGLRLVLEARRFSDELRRLKL